MGDSYICSGAMMRCTMGTTPARLTVLPARTVMLTGQPMANISDHLTMVNLAPFGLCRSLGFPATASATAAAQGALTPMPCMHNTPFPWMGGKMDCLIQNQPALLKSSKCQCMWGGTISIIFDGQMPTVPSTPIPKAPKFNTSSMADLKGPSDYSKESQESNGGTSNKSSNSNAQGGQSADGKKGSNSSSGQSGHSQASQNGNPDASGQGSTRGSQSYNISSSEKEAQSGTPGRGIKQSSSWDDPLQSASPNGQSQTGQRQQSSTASDERQQSSASRESQKQSSSSSQSQEQSQQSTASNSESIESKGAQQGDSSSTNSRQDESSASNEDLKGKQNGLQAAANASSATNGFANQDSSEQLEPDIIELDDVYWVLNRGKWKDLKVRFIPHQEPCTLHIVFHYKFDDATHDKQKAAIQFNIPSSHFNNDFKSLKYYPTGVKELVTLIGGKKQYEAEIQNFTSDLRNVNSNE